MTMLKKAVIVTVVNKDGHNMRWRYVEMDKWG